MEDNTKINPKEVWLGVWSGLTWLRVGTSGRLL